MAALCFIRRPMEELYAARFNVYWYLSFIMPAAIMLAFTYWKNTKLLILGIFLSLFTTYALCNFSVQEKWRIRYEIAKTEEEWKYATADGANLVFTAFFIAPLESVLYTSVWGLIGWKSKKWSPHRTK